MSCGTERRRVCGGLRSVSERTAQPVLMPGTLHAQRDSGMVEELDGQTALTVGTNAGAEEGEHPASRPIGERVNQTHVIGAEEGHPLVVTVQENADPFRGAAGLQPGPGLGACWELVTVAQPQRPVAILRAQLDTSVSVYGLRGHAQVPLGFRSNFHLPVVSAWLEALGGQNINTLEEALVVVVVGDGAATFDCQRFVSWDENAWVRCVDIKC